MKPKIAATNPARYPVIFKIPEIEAKPRPNCRPEPDTTSPLTIHDAIKPVYYVLKCLELWPYRYKKHNEIEPLTAKNRFLACLMAITAVVYYLYSCYFRARTFFVAQYPALLISDVMYAVCTHVLFVISILNSNYPKFGCLTQDFLLGLDQLNSYGLISARELRRNILRQTVAIISTGTAIILLNVVTSIIMMGVQDVKMFLSNYLLQLFVMLLFLKIDTKVEALLQHFRGINGRFGSCTNSHKKLRELAEIHASLCNLINLTSEGHGWEIVLLVIMTASKILHSVHITIIHVVKQLYCDVALSLKITTRVAQIGTTVYYCGLIVLLAMKCSRTRKEAYKIGLSASDSLLKIPVNELDPKVLFYKEELQLLINQISFRQPNFSAAGIFDVDYTTISTVLGITLSYSVVLLQFQN